MATANPQDFQIKVKLSVCSGSSEEDDHIGVLSKGTVALLRGIKDKGSLNKAAKDLHMAYSKAWRIVKETEEGFGYLLVNRDGARGSALTEEGEKMLEVYEGLCEEVEAFAQKLYRERIGS